MAFTVDTEYWNGKEELAYSLDVADGPNYASDRSANALKDIFEKRCRMDNIDDPHDAEPTEWVVKLSSALGAASDTSQRIMHRASALDQPGLAKELRAEFVGIAATALLAIECLDRELWQPRVVCGLEPWLWYQHNDTSIMQTQDGYIILKNRTERRLRFMGHSLILMADFDPFDPKENIDLGLVEMTAGGISFDGMTFPSMHDVLLHISEKHIAGANTAA